LGEDRQIEEIHVVVTVEVAVGVGLASAARVVVLRELGEVEEIDGAVLICVTTEHEEIEGVVKTQRLALIIAYACTPDVQAVIAVGQRLCPSERRALGDRIVRQVEIWTGRSGLLIDEGEGRPSRWNTLRALRVLDWASART